MNSTPSLTASPLLSPAPVPELGEGSPKLEPPRKSPADQMPVTVDLLQKIVSVGPELFKVTPLVFVRDALTAEQEAQARARPQNPQARSPVRTFEILTLCHINMIDR